MIHSIDDSNFILQNLKMETLPQLHADISFVLVKANWCGYCKQYIPMFEALSGKFADINFLVLDEEDNSVLLNQWANLLSPAFPQITGFPTLVMYDHNGSFVKIVEDRFMLDSEILKHRTRGQ